MSIIDNKVQFDPNIKRKKLFLFVLSFIEIVLTISLSFVLVLGRWFSLSSDAAVGVPNKLSYQGRLTDTSGNALGGSGTNYCFRFSLYDAALGGSKIWPSGTPASSTLSVVSGVFNATIGQADTLNYDFYSTDTVYLNVEVNTSTSTCHAANFETMTPRQQVLATGFAITSQNVYGSLLKTDITASSVQIGTGSGNSAPKFLSLDVQNTGQDIGSSCSVNGQLWYNSNASNTETLVCDNGSIRAVADSGPRRWMEVPMPRVTINNLTNITALSARPIFMPFYLEGGNLTISRINFEMSRSTSGSNKFSVTVGIYTYVNNTQLSLLGSASGSFSNTATASVSGVRRFAVNNIPTAISSLGPGGYVFGMMFSNDGNTQSASMNYFLRGGQTANPVLGGVFAGADSYNTATSYNYFPFFGRLSATTSAFPTSVGDSQVLGQFSGASTPLAPWIGLNND